MLDHTLNLEFNTTDKLESDRLYVAKSLIGWIIEAQDWAEEYINLYQNYMDTRTLEHAKHIVALGDSTQEYWLKKIEKWEDESGLL